MTRSQIVSLACLVAPLYQYPNRSSQIYKQAEERNVTLLSYVHVRFLMDYAKSKSLQPLWNTPRSLSPSKDARRYWEAIDDAVVAISQTSYEALQRYKKMEIDAASSVGQEGISYWESVKQDYHQLSRDEAIARLIQSEKIDQKINTIQKQISRVRRSING